MDAESSTAIAYAVLALAALALAASMAYAMGYRIGYRKGLEDAPPGVLEAFIADVAEAVDAVMQGVVCLWEDTETLLTMAGHAGRIDEEEAAPNEGETEDASGKASGRRAGR